MMKRYWLLGFAAFLVVTLLAIPAMAQVLSTPQRWVIQAVYEGSTFPVAGTDRLEVTSATLARKPMLDACNALAARMNLPAPRITVSLRALIGESTATYFPCNMTADAPSRASSYVVVTAIAK